MRDLPWQKLNIPGTLYLAKASITLESISLIVTDLQKVWAEHDHQTLQKLQRCSPDLYHTPLENLIPHLKNLLFGNDTVWIVEHTQELLTLKACRKISSVELKWIFDCRVLNDDTLRIHLIEPLILLALGLDDKLQKQSKRLLESENVLKSCDETFNLLKIKDRPCIFY
jgi:hypothetical protein